MKKILIIEKQTSSRQLLMQLLKKKKLQLFSVEDGAGALELLKKRSFDVILSDYKGIETLNRLGRRPLGTPLIFLKDFQDKALKNVDAILEKPLETSHLEKILFHLGDKKNSTLGVIAKSLAMKKVLTQVKKIAKSHSNVFICGESGTGKEVVSSMIHALSKRSSASFVRVNCAALSDTLIESEFFGHEKGAFTGAHTKRVGRFEFADKGTLLLDEISEIPSKLQAKLLRVVQEQEFERVGGIESYPIDVRLIATSNRDMKEAIKKGEFREDLYYRLNVIPIYLPPLRERVEDILPLVEHFLKEVCQNNETPLKIFSKKAQSKLLSCKWPGNIRQLRNVVEYAVIMNDGEEISEEHLFFEEGKNEHSKEPVTLQELEKKHILATLKGCNGNRTQAANKLGISVRTLRNKLKLYSDI